MSEADLRYAPATQLVALIRAKKLSPVELTRAVLERIERLNPVVNASCTVPPDAALDAARATELAVVARERLGPLHGIPVSIKDLHLTKGVRTMAGSFIFLDRVPNVDAPFVRRLKEAGAVIVGKTTTPEFGWKAIGDSPLTGITRNPWNTKVTTGGSSAGAGAAAAAGMGPLHQGSDGAGSIRIPSGFCGVYGLKPTYGRVPTWRATTRSISGSGASAWIPAWLPVSRTASATASWTTSRRAGRSSPSGTRCARSSRSTTCS